LTTFRSPYRLTKPSQERIGSPVEAGVGSVFVLRELSEA
jgi:hypothetical protein